MCAHACATGQAARVMVPMGASGHVLRSSAHMGKALARWGQRGIALLMGNGHTQRRQRTACPLEGVNGQARARRRNYGRAKRAIDGTIWQGARSMVRAGKARARLYAWARRVIGGADGRGARSLAPIWTCCVVDDDMLGKSHARVCHWASLERAGNSGQVARSMTPMGKSCDRWRTWAWLSLDGAIGQGARSLAQLGKALDRWCA